MVVQPPRRIPLWLRPGLWLARRMTGKDPLPGRLLAHFPKGAVAAGMLELGAPHGPRDLDARVLAIARLTASAIAGCPFCVDMNAASSVGAGLSRAEIMGVLALDAERRKALPARERLAVVYAEALSRSPVAVDEGLATSLRAVFSERELVVLAFTVAQVNFWSRFNHGLGVPAAGFFDEPACLVAPSPHARTGEGDVLKTTPSTPARAAGADAPRTSSPSATTSGRWGRPHG